MKYTLVTKQGKVFNYYIESVAKMFQTIYGGTITVSQ